MSKRFALSGRFMVQLGKTNADYKYPFLFAILCAIKYFTKFLKKNEVWLSSNLRESARSHVQRQWCNRRRKNHHKRVSASLESVLPNSVAEDEIDCCGLDQIFKVRRQSVAIYLAGK